jgi:alpha-amylase
MSREITALNWFKRAMHGSGEHFSNPIHEVYSLLMIERGAGGVVIINSGEEVELDEADTELLEDGTYIDIISGNEFVVSDSKISGTVNAESVVVIY